MRGLLFLKNSIKIGNEYMSKKKNIIIDFQNAYASEHVTGSCYHIKTPNNEMLIELGLAQTNQIKRDYEINNKKFKFKHKHIDYIFCCHVHGDHSLGIPRMYKGEHAPQIIMPKGTKAFFKEMCKDSVHIMQRDAETLDKINKKHKHEPIYTMEEVNKALESVVEYEIGIKYKLNDDISFEFIGSGHIIHACQLKLYIKDGETVKTIGYTSDLGNITFPKRFASTFEPIKSCDVLIGESTYSNRDNIKQTARTKDIEKLDVVIKQTCIEKHGSILVPAFALDRTVNFLSMLYGMYGKDESFRIPVIIDGKLVHKITKCYKQTLEGEELEHLNEILNWKNVREIDEFEETRALAEDNVPKIIIAGSGMMTAGRSIYYAKKLIGKSKSHFVFIGYSAENTLASKIRNHQLNITIDRKVFKNRASCTVLRSFSSHMQQQEMLDYYSSVETNCICLVHGNSKDKQIFANKLRDIISDKAKTTKVTCANKSSRITI